MAFKKRTSPKIEAAKMRADSLRSVDPALDFGKDKKNQPVTLAALDQSVADAEGLLSQYNQMLSTLDGLGNQIGAAENKANDLSTRLLSGVGSRFGKDSDEYEKAGGTKTDEIVRKPRTPKSTTPKS